jgi:hypothetical protein
MSLQGQPRGPACSLFEKITKENFDPASPTPWPCRVTIGQPDSLKQVTGAFPIKQYDLKFIWQRSADIISVPSEVCHGEYPRPMP